MEPNKPDESSEQPPVEQKADMPVATPQATSEQAPDAPATVEPAPVNDKPAEQSLPVEPEDVHEVEPEAEQTPDKPAKITAPIFVSKSYTFPEILTSLGFASLFFVYSAVAYLHPETLQTAYLHNDLGENIGHATLMVQISMFVNLFLGALLLLGRRKTMVYALAGTWLIVIAVFKVLNLLG